MIFTKNDNGFTGIEAAIILIAFVVVAAVFSTMMLGAGFFTTQKSQEVVHSGIMEVSSSLAPSGNVIVKSTADGSAGEIIFYVTNTAGGSPVDLNKTIITYTDNDDFVSQEYSTGTNRWTYTPIIYDPGHNDNLLESGEKYKIDLNLTTFGVKTLPGSNEQVKIEVKPPEGAVLVIQPTMPPELDNNTYYQVY
jgi:archaeal flagellin FlaB